MSTNTTTTYSQTELPFEDLNVIRQLCSMIADACFAIASASEPWLPESINGLGEVAEMAAQRTQQARNAMQAYIDHGKEYTSPEAPEEPLVDLVEAG